MSTPSPLQPQNALDGASTPKSRMRVTVLTILALHVVFIGGLLMQGCDKKPGSASTQSPSTASSLPSLGDTNYFSNFPGDAPGSATSGGASAGGAAQGSGAIPPVDSAASGLANSTTSGAGLAGAGSGLADGAGAASRAPSPIAGTGVGSGSSSLPVASSPTEPTSGSPGVTEHVIKQGDKIGDLAKVYHVSAQAIIDANPNAKPRSLKVGDRLMIPPPPAASTTASASSGTGTTGAAAAEGDVYVVKAGDNLSKIAKKFGVTVKALRAANNMKSDRLVAKQRLTIPAKPAAGTTH